MRDKKFYKNLMFSLISFGVSIIQSVWFVPFIMKNMGAEPYGYIAVVMNFINVSTIISVAITSMSSRYISIELQKRDYKEANQYFNSIISAVIIIGVVLAIIFTIIICNITQLMNVSYIYKSQVQVLFAIAAISLIISILNTPFLAGLYHTNRLYVMYTFITLNYVFKIIVSIIFLNFGEIKLWNMAFGGVIIDVASIIYYLSNYRRYMPNLVISASDSKIKYIITVLKSGIWVSITKAGAVLLTTISTYISNLFVSAMITGIYASIMQLQSLIAVLVVAIVSCFVPQMYKNFAENKNIELIEYTKQSIRFLSIPLGLLSGGIIVYGKYFMILWLGESFGNYEKLIILIMIYLPFSLTAEMLNQVNITIDKIKIPAIVTVIMGCVNIFMTYFLIKVLNMGIYGIALSQGIINGIRGFIFFPLYTSYEFKISKKTFYPAMLSCPLVSLITIFTCLIIETLGTPNTWLKLIANAVVVAFIVLSVVSKIVLSKDERNSAMQLLKRKKSKC